MLQLLIILPFSWNQLSCFLATDPWLIVVSIMHLSSWFTKHNELFCFVGSQPCIWCVKWEILHRELQTQQGLLWLHFGTEWQMKVHSEREPRLLQLCGAAFPHALRTRRSFGAERIWAQIWDKCTSAWQLMVLSLCLSSLLHGLHGCNVCISLFSWMYLT